MDGGSKEDYFESDWFRHFIKPVRRWYRRKYGDALQSKDGKLIGLVDAFGTYFRIDILKDVRAYPEASFARIAARPFPVPG